MEGRTTSRRSIQMWTKRHPAKIMLALAIIILMLLALGFMLKHPPMYPFYVFIFSNSIHAIGIFTLIYKLVKKKSCEGLSLKTQQLSALFMSIKLYFAVVEDNPMEACILLAALAATLWVIYTICYKLNSSYFPKVDKFPIYYLVITSAVLAMMIHPKFFLKNVVDRLVWAFCSYVEAVSVLPQLVMIQNAKVVEGLTAQYVFALGVERFLRFVYWIVTMFESHRGGYFLLAPSIVSEYGLWVPMMILCEIVQAFILADFCYYYCKGLARDRLVMILPTMEMP